MQKYILRKWLELAESDKIYNSIIALKELSKYSFNVQAGSHIPTCKSIENEKSF